MKNEPSVYIELYDLPPRVAGDRTPRIIGRLTPAGIALRDSFPPFQDINNGDVYGYHFDAANGYALKSSAPLTEKEVALESIVQALSQQAMRENIHRNSDVPFLKLIPYDDGNGVLSPTWHRDASIQQAMSIFYIIGGQIVAGNTQYVTKPVSLSMLPFDYTAGSRRRDEQALDEFIHNYCDVTHVGANEILEMFGDTPHRSSPYRVGMRQFMQYDFNS